MSINNQANNSPKYFCFGFWILCYLLSGCTLQPQKTISTPIPVSQALNLAVWDFDNNSVAGGEFDYLSKALSEMLLTNLSQAPDIRLVERVNMREVLEEQHLSASQLASDEMRLKLGRISGANHMAFGSYMVIGNQVRIDVRVADVETSQVKFSENVTGLPQDAAKQMQIIAQHIAAKLASSSIAGQGVATEMAHWKRYEEGIALMDKHLYEQAITVFTDVLKSDPNFKAAEKQIRLALELQTRQ